MSDCIFCKIANHEIPSNVVYEDENALAFLDVNPGAEGHTLVVPKKHATTINDMSAEELGQLFQAVSKVSAAINKALKPDGINLHQNNGTAAGQVVPHVHVHIIPRRENDGLTFPWSPKAAGDELKTVAEKIKSCL